MFRKLILSIIAIAAPNLLTAAEPPLRLLFLGDQNHHQPAMRFKDLQPPMAKHNIALTYTEDVDSLNLATLNQYDGLILYANIDTIEPAQEKALLQYVASGKGFIPLHCATYCFRNSPEIVALMGAQFQRHGTGEMTTQSAEIKHPVLDGYQTFTSWDETYVHHKHNDHNRVVLEYRTGDVQANGNIREPWTWIRTHGEGRIFYTAWGHDHRTWSQPEFLDLIERGIRWACGEGATGIVSGPGAAVLPPQKVPTKDLKSFDYTDVGPEIPNYAAGRGKTLNRMQQPAPAEESMKHVVTPEGFHIERFADESMLDGKMFTGKPIAMTWDPQGRLWVCETVDYPNELKTDGIGRDRIRVLEDTDGDGQADASTIFAENLSIPTAIAFHRGGLVVQNGTETLYLKDTDNDGKADLRKVLISNWTLTDTHGGVSNFRNGLDNWIWGMQGYNNSAPIINGKKHASFRMGFFRFKLSQNDDPTVEKLEFVRSTTNNTWGLGISEEGLIFGSTANRAPSFFMPIANRYYERVQGWAPEGLQMISPDHLFHPITDKVRQVDHHGGYTAAAGHALYTARNYPEAWWNRTAFVCGPTGKLVGTFVIQPDGAGMKSSSPINLFASDDEWTAPIMAEVGPDGNVWVLDWYNYIVQHNPTPQGFKTGKGHAYETKLRDKKYGRIYRVVPDSPNASAPVSLTARSSPEELLAALTNPTMEVRLSAQRLLVERQDSSPSMVASLLALVEDQSVDSIGLNVGAIHALQTLHGLGLLESAKGPIFQQVARALSHPSAGVRLNAVRVLPNAPETVAALGRAELIQDRNAQVVLATLLKLSDAPSANASPILRQAIASDRITSDRWLTDAATSACAMNAFHFLNTTFTEPQSLPAAALPILSRIAEHFARSNPSADAMSELLRSLAVGDTKQDSGSDRNLDAVVNGLTAGWGNDHVIVLGDSVNDSLRQVFNRASGTGKASLARLAAKWSNRSLESEIQTILDDFLQLVEQEDLPVKERLEAASQLIQLAPARTESVEGLVSLIGTHSPKDLSIGLIEQISQSKVTNVGDPLLGIIETGTPDIRNAVIRAMLSRPQLTMALLRGMEKGKIQISDLSIEQRGSLASHPSPKIRTTIADLMKQGGVVVNNDRAKLVTAKLLLAEAVGDPERGKAIFTKNCATCHVFKGNGTTVGPNLNGMSVHPKTELLTHILDPNRSVEANYRLYTALTVDGEVISGLLSAESLTSIEMVDVQGKKHTILREDIEQLQASTKSAMPEGFEQSIDDASFIDLLEYLTQRERFVPLGLERVANIITTEGLFTNRENRAERLVMPQWGTQMVDEVPFSLIDPAGTAVKNGVMLNGPNGSFAPQMPSSVSVRCRTPASKIHLLGGVAGWASKRPQNGGVSMIVRLQYSDGQTEDHPLIDGQHIADYIGIFDVPESKLAFKMRDGGQLRYLAITPKRDAMIDTIQLVKPKHHTAPIIMAITVELPAKH